MKYCPVLLTLFLLGCSQNMPMPVVDFDQPGWQVWTGQALWQPPGDTPSVAGDILISLHESGDRFIELIKGPVAVFSAQTHSKFWWLKLIDRGDAYSGKGKPPARFIWFYLPELVDQCDDKSVKHWQVEYPNAETLVLTNKLSGEKITLVMDQAI